ncbi:MAG: DinB family protein [Deinococcales bacterium]|jgi:hypothetical protein
MPDPSSADATPHETLRRILKSQYHAGLAMLHECIERCPDDLWADRTPTNAFWQIAYHTLFFTHLYLMPREADFRPWTGHQADVQHPDGIPGRADPDSRLPLLPQPYSRTQVLAYWRVCDGLVDEAVDALDLDQPTSGFSWYRMSKLEHQLVNLRHVQHHAAQLADRLRAADGIGIDWVGGSPVA